MVDSGDWCRPGASEMSTGNIVLGFPSLNGKPSLFKAFSKGFLSLFKAFSKGFLSFFKAFFKGFLSFLLKAFFKGFLSFLKGFF